MEKQQYQPPLGFMPLAVSKGNAFYQYVGPFYFREEEGRFVLGFTVEQRHANPGASCHGGMMMTFIDTLLPTIAHLQHGKEKSLEFTPTVALSVDFIAPAPVGSWVEGRVRALRLGGRLNFLDGLVTVGDNIVARANGIFRVIER